MHLNQTCLQKNLRRLKAQVFMFYHQRFSQVQQNTTGGNFICINQFRFSSECNSLLQ